MSSYSTTRVDEVVKIRTGTGIAGLPAETIPNVTKSLIVEI